MSSYKNAKLAVLAALRNTPDFSSLACLHSLRPAQLRRFLAWCDHNGVSAYFLQRLRGLHIENLLSPGLLFELQSRADANRARSAELFADFRIVNEALASSGARYLALKGVTLFPEFCPSLALRHQTDLDFWIDPAHLPFAVASLVNCGYSFYSRLDSGTVMLTNGAFGSMSLHESVYKPGRPRKIELHTRLLEDTEPIALEFPVESLHPPEFRTLDAATFPAMSLSDRFLFQALHAFQHTAGGWTRLAWFYEIASFLQRMRTRESLWQAVAHSLARDPLLRNAVGLILEIVRHTFAAEIPEPLQIACTSKLPGRIPLWCRHFAADFVVSERAGNKNVLFVKEVFVPDARVWRAFLAKALFPRKASYAIRETRGLASGPAWANRGDQFAYVAHRLGYHARSLAAYPVQWLRWQLLLRTGAG